MNNQRTIKFLSFKEVRQIIDAIPQEGLINRRDRAILEVLFSTGLRVSECLSLKRNDLMGDPKQTLELPVIGKGKVQRTVYISSPALQTALRYFAGRVDESELAFPIGVRSVQLMVKRRAKEAGVTKPLTVHTFRHSMATYMLKQGASLFYVQQFLGHAHLATTSIYLHATNKELLDIHKKLMR